MRHAMNTFVPIDSSTISKADTSVVLRRSVTKKSKLFIMKKRIDQWIYNLLHQSSKRTKPIILPSMKPIITPERTALMSFDNDIDDDVISLCYDDHSHAFHPDIFMNSQSSDGSIFVLSNKQTLVPTTTTTENFQSWQQHGTKLVQSHTKPIQKSFTTTTSTGRSTTKSSTMIKGGRHGISILRKLQSVWCSNRATNLQTYDIPIVNYRSNQNINNNTNVDDEDDHDSEEHFSISTDLRYHLKQQPHHHPHHIGISTSKSTEQLSSMLPPPSETSSRSSSQHTIFSSNITTNKKTSKISLDEYLEDRTKISASSSIPLTMGISDVDNDDDENRSLKSFNLGYIRADDTESVGSASLDVMFKRNGDYPQLVLTPSIDGIPSTTSNSKPTVHVVAPKQSKNRFSTLDKNQNIVISNTIPAWLQNAVVDREKYDFNVGMSGADPDGRYAPDDDPYNDNDDDDNFYQHEPDVELNQNRLQHQSSSSIQLMDWNMKDPDVGIIDLEDTENSTDEDLDDILDTNDDDMVDENKIFLNSIIALRDDDEEEEKFDRMSFRSFSPFDEMGWSISDVVMTNNNSIPNDPLCTLHGNDSKNLVVGIVEVTNTIPNYMTHLSYQSNQPTLNTGGSIVTSKMDSKASKYTMSPRRRSNVLMVPKSN